jgi:hypothetical protein
MFDICDKPKTINATTASPIVHRMNDARRAAARLAPAACLF